MGLSAQESAFGAEVERCRAAVNVSQAWVAQRVGLSRSKISEIGSGKYLPSWPVLQALITALGMDRERTVALWRAAKDAGQERRQRERMQRHREPAEWAGLSRLPQEIWQLLRAQQRLALELPYRLPGARRVSLETVYVRQALGSGVAESESEPARPQPMLDGRGMLHVPSERRWRLVVRPPSRPMRDAMDEHAHVLVTAGPGQGKSTLSLRLSAEIAGAWLAGGDGEAPLGEPVVPLRLTARELASRLHMPWGEALAASVRSTYGALLATELGPQVLVDRVAGCRWLLLIDGLDEIADSDLQDRLVTVLTEWAADPAVSPYRILLTTRPVDSAALVPLHRTAAHFELLPFDEAALRRFAHQWFAPEDAETAERFLRQIRQAYLDELVQVPLLATIAAIVFTEHADRPLPDNQYQLYEAYLRFLRTGRGRTPSRFEHLRDGLLQHLGCVRLEHDTSLVIAACDWVTEHAQGLGPAAEWCDELVTFLTAVGPLVRRGEDLKFLHHSFAEHLAATAEAHALPQSFDPAHDRLVGLIQAGCVGERGRYARTVLVHYTRVQPAQADQLVRWLHAGNAELNVLAAQLLAQRVPASIEVIDAFLVTARAWAMTRYWGAAILSAVSRAGQHPGLIAWLADVMHDPAVPWPTRIEAATALATRLRGAHASEATALLRCIVHDPQLAVADRLTAAERLTDCGGADRDTAERELGTLLTDPTLTARRRRTAAVVLARLGSSARTAAIECLLTPLDDPDAPVQDLIESAIGLAEIGTEFHPRCAAVLQAILDDPGRTPEVRGDAALGLAALGPHHQAHAVATLTDIVANPALWGYERKGAVKVLTDLGAQYRPVAGQLLIDMLAEPGLDAHGRWHAASALADLGTEYHSAAATHLQALIADRDAGTNATYWALHSLADLGPTWRAEATAGLQHFADDPLTDGIEHAYALGRLAALSASHRPDAATRLSAELHDRDAEPGSRVWAADELMKLGPEFHSAVVAVLRDITAREPDVYIRSRAWRILVTLDARFQRPATEALLAALRSPAADSSLLDQPEYQFVALDAIDRQQVAHVLAEVLFDRTHGDELRGRAAVSLIALGRQFHHTALAGFVMVLRSREKLWWNLEVYVAMSLSLGAGLRDRLAKTVQAQLSDPDMLPDDVRQAGRALILLGQDMPEVRSALRAVAFDHGAWELPRCDAAVALAQLDAAERPDAVTVFRQVAKSLRSRPEWWTRKVFELAQCGGEVTELVGDLLADPDVPQPMRAAAATVLARLDTNQASAALIELRNQAADGYLDSRQRMDVVTRLADLDPSQRPHAIAYCQTLLDDEAQPVDVRGAAAAQLVQLDRTQWPTATATMRRIDTDPSRTPAETYQALNTLHGLKALKPAELARHALAVAHPPAASPALRRDALNLLPAHLRLDTQQAMLDDHAAPITARVPAVKCGERGPLFEQTAAALREALTAAETSLGERVDAAKALAELSAQFVPDALQALQTLIHASSQISVQAQVVLARLSGRWRRQIIQHAERGLTDLSQHPRERYRVLELLGKISPTFTDAMLTALRTLASTGRTANRRQIDGLITLSRSDGLAPLRALRDNPQATPAARWRAAMHLTANTTDDRATAARLLHQLATTPTLPAALRWRAARDLATLGTTGRDLAITALRALATDPTLVTTARAHAARELATVHSTSRPAALTTLRALTSTPNPLHRAQVWLAIGAFDTTDAAPALRAMAHDRTLSPVARLRCAQALARLRRDYREAAALTARDLMHTPTIPTHIRRSAARDLARWSTLCRQEARDALATLTANQPTPATART